MDAMENHVQVRAKLASCKITDKAVLQIELDPKYNYALPQLSTMVTTNVTIDITSDQLVIPVEKGNGQVDGQTEAFVEDDADEPDDIEDVEVLELPPAEFDSDDVDEPEDFDEVEDDEEE